MFRRRHSAAGDWPVHARTDSRRRALDAGRERALPQPERPRADGFGDEGLSRDSWHRVAAGGDARIEAVGDIAAYAPLLEESAEDLYEHAPCGYLSALPNGIIAKV